MIWLFIRRFLRIYSFFALVRLYLIFNEANKHNIIFIPTSIFNFSTGRWEK